MEHPELRKRQLFSPIWFLPFLALCICGWLLYTGYRDAGVDIVIHFKTAEGIIAGKTRVIYKGIPVGTVTDVLINADRDSVLVQVDMDKETRPLLVEDAAFWIVKPVISAGKISGLQTLVSGSYIAIRKGGSTAPRRDFSGLEEPPPVTSNMAGLHLRLQSDALYSLQRRSNIYSKNLKIGVVDDYRMTDNGKMLIDIFIQPEYSHLIRQGTRFWNASGLSVSGDLQNGLSVNIASMASLLYGGLACATPEPLADSPPAEEGATFPLYRDFEDARYGIPMTLQLADGAGIVAGKTKMMFRGLKVGIVRSLNLNNDQFHTVTATILLDPRAEKILRQHTRFWVIRPEVSLEGINNISTIISGPYITFQAGDGKFTDHFTVESSPAPKSFDRPGQRFTLISKQAESLSIGAPVLYKQRAVGTITDVRFTDDGKKTATTILIYKPYVPLVRRDAVFWNSSGVELHGSLTSFTMNMGSMRSFISGGIAFANPVSARAAQPQPLPKAGQSFQLYNSRQDAVNQVPAMRKPGKVYTLQVEGAVPVHEGASVLFNRIAVGELLEFHLNHVTNTIEAKILIYSAFTRLINSSTRFYNISGLSLDASLQGISLHADALETVLGGGISFLTPQDAPAAKKEHRFTLYPDRDRAMEADGLILELHLENAAGINTRTTIKYQGITIGHLSRIWLDPDQNKVLARAVVQKNATGLLRSSSTLWLIKPQIDLSGIRYLATAISGPYIDLHPGQGKLRTSFTVHDTTPGVLPVSSGLNLILETPHLGSLRIGRAVYYRQIPVGKITGVELGPTAQNVWVHINIRPRYQQIVHRGTRFWHASGINVTGSLFSGISVATESLETLVAGGITLATPEGDAMGKPAQNGDHFLMADQAEQEWLDWAPEINLSLAPTRIPVYCPNKPTGEQHHE